MGSQAGSQYYKYITQVGGDDFELAFMDKTQLCHKHASSTANFHKGNLL